MSDATAKRLKYQDILTYWFGHIPGHQLTSYQSLQVLRRLHFWAGNWGRRLYDVDTDMRRRFGTALDLAGQGYFDHWVEYATGRLALILLLDQFSRNIHRGTPRAFEFDSKCLGIADEGIVRGQDKMFYPVARCFFYLPLEHQEDLAYQERALAGYREAIRGTGPLERMIIGAEIVSSLRHRQLVQKFGRFPHRNKILGRRTTPEETRFLKQPFTHF